MKTEKETTMHGVILGSQFCGVASIARKIQSLFGQGLLLGRTVNRWEEILIENCYHELHKMYQLVKLKIISLPESSVEPFAKYCRYRTDFVSLDKGEKKETLEELWKDPNIQQLWKEGLGFIF